MYNILVCDDEKDIVSALEIYLTSEGYRVFKAYNGREALGVIQKEDIHLVLLDVMMPGLNGFETLKRMRGVGITIPVIFLTAAEDNETLHEAEELGVPCVRKPFRPDDLLNAVRNAIGAVK